MADTVEATFKLGARKDTATPALGAVTTEQVKAVIAKKSMRIADLAKQFSAPPYEIERIVNNDEVFEKGAMGWIKLKNQ